MTGVCKWLQLHSPCKATTGWWRLLDLAGSCPLTLLRKEHLSLTSDSQYVLITYHGPPSCCQPVIILYRLCVHSFYANTCHSDHRKPLIPTAGICIIAEVWMEPYWPTLDGAIARLWVLVHDRVIFVCWSLTLLQAKFQFSVGCSQSTSSGFGKEKRLGWLDHLPPM